MSARATRSGGTRRRTGACLAVLAVLLSSACAGRTTQRGAVAAGDRATVATVLACLRHSGADVADVSARRDLRVSNGELAVAFSTFDAYVGIAATRAEATAAAGRLDSDLAVLQQAGHAVVRRAAVFYFDAPIVPRSAGRVVAACLDGSDGRAVAAMAALAAELPAIELPSGIETRFLARCGGVGSPPGCACAYRHASRLLRFAQVDGIGRTWVRPRAHALLAGLLRTCAPPAL